MDKNLFSQHIVLKNVKLKDSFWSDIQELVRLNVIPYQYEALHDRIADVDKSYCIENFKKAYDVKMRRNAGEELPAYPTDKWHYDEYNSCKEAFKGWVFQDSDAYKWLEAVAYSLSNHWDDELWAKAKEIIELICSVQLDNGYLNTLYIINNPENAFTNLKDFHELYCFGHMTEAAVAIFESTGDAMLLDASKRYADLLCKTFGKNKLRGYGGHEIIELALVKLFRVTGEEKYLDLASFFVDERGQKPFFFDEERGEHTDGRGYIYNQAHMPVRQQSEAVGHAVRGVYLYTGMADIAKHNMDNELYLSCKKIWDNIVQKKMYITGGIGSTVDGEAFTFDYDLPNDLAYCETCASIGLAFFAQRMLEISPDSSVADAMERALYNTILSGMSENGKSFFYVNPLEVLPQASHTDSRKRHVKPVRQGWYDCACCPPNLARMLSSIGEYCATQNASTIFIHQYIGGEYTFENAVLYMDSDYVNSGRVTIDIKPSFGTKIALRIPAWCTDFAINAAYDLVHGYAYIEVCDDMQIIASFTPKIRLVKCSNRVRENVGKVAVMRGAMVYCLEEFDNGADLQMLSIYPNTSFNFVDNTIIAKGFREAPDDDLYSTYSAVNGEDVELRLIPYYKWANRGENEMTVYIRTKNN